MSSRSVISAAILLLVCVPCRADDRHRIDQEVGLRVTLPSSGWEMSDLSRSGVVAHLYAPPGVQVPRVTLMRFPKAFLPDGLATRASQVERTPGVERVRLEPAKLAGQDGHLYECAGHGVRTLEYGLERGAYLYVVQLAAKETDWESEAKAEAYTAFFASVGFTGGPAPTPPPTVDPKTPAEVRAARAAARHQGWPYAIRHHALRLDVFPDERRLLVTDDLVLEALVDELTELNLLCTHVDVLRVRTGATPLAFRRRNPRVVTVTLDTPLRKGATISLHYEAEGNPYSFAQDQKLIAEIAVRGQVNEPSSFSSHVLYYPIDLENDATVHTTLSVPAGYVGITGGTYLGFDEKEGRRIFRYELKGRSPRLLPVGFAVARYEEVGGRTPGGLELVVFHPRNLAKAARQRLDIALEAGALFERLMGPLPWKRVAFCHVVPERKEMGVSLPGQVLISDGFFRDAEGVTLRGDALDEPGVKGLLLVVDELSHQWNGYATPLPNELAEGVSTFTNLLFLESTEGNAEYRSGLEYCAQAYLASAAVVEDVAVADPKLYQSDIFRAVAFCKVAVVLDLLRRRLGDETFFHAWRKAFTGLRGRPIDFADFERALSDAAKTDLHGFFDQWFFQAGHPQLKVTWSCETEAGQLVLVLDAEQVQPGGLYDLRVPIEVAHKGAVPTRLNIDVNERRQTLRVPVSAEADDLRVDPDGTRLLLRAEVLKMP